MPATQISCNQPQRPRIASLFASHTMSAGQLEDIPRRDVPTSDTAKWLGTADIQAEAKFALYRRLVPITEKVTYLNASFAPPSNLIVQEAISRFSYEAPS